MNNLLENTVDTIAEVDNTMDGDNDNIEKQTLNKLIHQIAEEYDISLPLKKKRGRKSKNELQMINKLKLENIIDDEIVYGEYKPVTKYKKRGRKPKGGKIIQNISNNELDVNVKTNVILHLKCFLVDIENNNVNNINNIYEGVSLQNNNNSTNKLSYNIIKSNANSSTDTLNNNLYNDQYTSNFNSKQVGNDDIKYADNIQYADALPKNDTDKKNKMDKDIYLKLKELEVSLRTNNINNKKSACFYCTEDFDNPPVYIPKFVINGSYHVYGCFCSPECSTGYLMKEQIDSSIKYERYFLLNNMYSKIYNYTKSIKPAPDPYYTLDKFFGNITIEEYRSLIKNKRLYILIDKPITRSLPELHEDNDDFIINNKIIPSNFQINKKSKRSNLKNQFNL